MAKVQKKYKLDEDKAQCIEEASKELGLVYGTSQSEIAQDALMSSLFPTDPVLLTAAMGLYLKPHEANLDCLALVFQHISEHPDLMKASEQHLQLVDAIHKIGQSGLSWKTPTVAAYPEYKRLYSAVMSPVQKAMAEELKRANSAYMKGDYDYFTSLLRNVECDYTSSAFAFLNVKQYWSRIDTNPLTYCLLASICRASTFKNLNWDVRMQIREALLSIDVAWKYGIGDGAAAPREGFISYDIEGGYVTVPNTWLVANPFDALRCHYCYVMEVKNGQLLGPPAKAPHVLFFSDEAIDNLDEDMAYYTISSVYPEAVSLYKQAKTANAALKAGTITIDEWGETLIPGIFQIMERSHYRYGPPPAGAYVVYTSTDKEQEGNLNQEGNS